MNPTTNTEAGAVADVVAKKHLWKCLLGFHDNDIQPYTDLTCFILTCKRCGHEELYR